jgi:hypothetical protein
LRSHGRLAALAVAVSLLASSAGADTLDVRRKYEETLIQAALARTGLSIDPAPEGKLIERVVIVANDVILPGDYGVPYRIPILYPLLAHAEWLNKVHVRTRDYIIAQELLFHAGERLSLDAIEESGRNLRAMFILAVARIVVARGSRPDRVVVLVMTKDNWTLRLNSNLSIDQARLDALSLSIAENNLAGRNKTISIEYALDPGRHTVGASYVDPRMNGSRHAMTMLGEVYLTRATSGTEGGYGAVTVGRPLYSLHTEWGWQLSLSYLKDKARQFQGGNLVQLKYGDEVFPYIYDRRVISGNLVGTRSWGVLDKLTVSAGFRVTSALYTEPEEFPATLSPAARHAFDSTILPRSESASGPFVSASAYRASYVRKQNINTFALTEDFQVGPSASFEIRFADPAFGFSSRYITFTGNYAAAYWARDNLFAVGMSGTARLQAGVVANTDWVNQVLNASVREVTPRFGPLRLHIAGLLQLRRNDLSRTPVTLGGESSPASLGGVNVAGLRGFAPREFIGTNVYRVNAELRSIALNLWTVHIGGVLFYDGGDAPVSLTTAGWHQDVGLGLRILFPQFNRDVLRLDLGFPMERPSSGGYAPRFTVEFGQAF